MAAITKHDPAINIGILGCVLINNPNTSVPSIAPILAAHSNIPLAVALKNQKTHETLISR